jgi:hypothetical protein
MHMRMQFFDVDSSTWVHPIVVGMPPSDAVFHAAVCVGHHMLVLGGQAPSDAALGLFVLDLLTLTWCAVGW